MTLFYWVFPISPPLLLTLNARTIVQILYLLLVKLLGQVKPGPIQENVMSSAMLFLVLGSGAQCGPLRLFAGPRIKYFMTHNLALIVLYLIFQSFHNNMSVLEKF